MTNPKKPPRQSPRGRQAPRSPPDEACAGPVSSTAALTRPRRAGAATALRRAIAQRVADAHDMLDPGPVCAMLLGSTVDGIADALSDIDMSIMFEPLPAPADLAAACRRAGGSAWTRHSDTPQGGLDVAFDLDGIEVEIAYTSPQTLQADLDILLCTQDPDTPYHKVGEGLRGAQALLGAERLQEWQARVAPFPPALADAMLRHHLGQPMPWLWVPRLLQRDAALWCRELQVDACYRLFGVLAALNRRYFTTHQFKRMRRFAEQLAITPPNLVQRVEALLSAPMPAAFSMLYALEGEVLALVATHAPHVDLSAPQRRRTHFRPPDGAA